MATFCGTMPPRLRTRADGENRTRDVQLGRLSPHHGVTRVQSRLSESNRASGIQAPRITVMLQPACGGFASRTRSRAGNSANRIDRAIVAFALLRRSGLRAGERNRTATRPDTNGVHRLGAAPARMDTRWESNPEPRVQRDLPDTTAAFWPNFKYARAQNTSGSSRQPSAPRPRISSSGHRETRTRICCLQGSGPPFERGARGGP